MQTTQIIDSNLNFSCFDIFSELSEISQYIAIHIVFQYIVI